MQRRWIAIWHTTWIGTLSDPQGESYIFASHPFQKTTSCGIVTIYLNTTLFMERQKISKIGTFITLFSLNIWKKIFLDSCRFTVSMWRCHADPKHHWTCIKNFRFHHYHQKTGLWFNKYIETTLSHLGIPCESFSQNHKNRVSLSSWVWMGTSLSFMPKITRLEKMSYGALLISVSPERLTVKLFFSTILSLFEHDKTQVSLL